MFILLQTQSCATCTKLLK